MNVLFRIAYSSDIIPHYPFGKVGQMDGLDEERGTQLEATKRFKNKSKGLTFASDLAPNRLVNARFVALGVGKGSGDRRFGVDSNHYLGFHLDLFDRTQFDLKGEPPTQDHRRRVRR